MLQLISFLFSSITCTIYVMKMFWIHVKEKQLYFISKINLYCLESIKKKLLKKKKCLTLFVCFKEEFWPWWWRKKRNKIKSWAFLFSPKINIIYHNYTVATFCSLCALNWLCILRFANGYHWMNEMFGVCVYVCVCGGGLGRGLWGCVGVFLQETFCYCGVYTCVERKRQSGIYI